MVANWMLQPHHAGLLWAWWSFFIACVWFLAIYQPWCQLLVLKRAELAASNPSQINTQLYRGHLSLQLDNWTLLEFPAKSPEKILKMYVGAIHKRRLLRGGGRGSPSKPINYISLFSNLSWQGEGGGVIYSGKWADIGYGWPLRLFPE